MKVVVCSLTYPLPNGVTSSINESVDGLIASGHQVRIIAPDYGKGKARPEHFPVSSSVFGRALVRFFGKKERMFGLGAAAEIKAIVDEFEPDVFWLHTVSWAQNAFEKIMLESQSRKVLTYHTMLDMYGRLYLGKLGEQAMILRSKEVANSVDAVITPSEYMKSKLVGWGVKTPISVVATGITEPKTKLSHSELTKKFRLPSNAKVMLYVGRVVKEKNISALISMTKKVVRKEPSAVLVLIGPGDIAETLAEADRLGIGGHVVCPGQLPLEDAKACYAGADVFVFASQSETQGLVIGEAMISNTPVVALRSPIQAEVYPEDVARVADSTNELASMVVEVLNDEPLRKDLTKRAKDYVTSNFSKEVMLQKQLDALTVPVKV